MSISIFNNASIRYSAKSQLVPTDLLLLIHGSRPDLQRPMPLHEEASICAFLLWFEMHGREEYGLCERLVPRYDWSDFESSWDGHEPLRKIHAVISCFDNKLKNGLALEELDDRLRLELVIHLKLDLALENSESHLKKALPSFQIGAEAKHFAVRPCTKVRNHLPIAFNELMYAIWLSRKDLQETFDITSEHGLAKFVLWFLNHGQHEVDLSGIDRSGFDDKHVYSNSDECSFLTNLAHLVWLSDPGLQSRYPINDYDAMDEFCASQHDYKVNSPGPVIAEKTTTALDVNSCKLHASTSLCEGNIQTRRIAGVDIVGSAHGMFGIAQHARMTLKALQHAEISTAMLDVLREGAPHEAADYSVRHSIAPSPIHEISIFVASPYLIPEAIGKYGSGLFEKSYNIFYGAWELEQLPTSWIPVLNQFDEAWAHSEFVFEAMKRSLTIPVYLMRQPVEVVGEHNLSRGDLEIADDEFVFLFVFDCCSRIARKNPVAAIEAFCRAFPNGNEHVRLILKTQMMHVAQLNEPELYAELMDAVARDARIQLVNERIPQQKVTALMDACDVYVSLHRAEGFGNTMGEAMLLGKPVIATNFSGNTDFTGSVNHACPVDFELVPVKHSEYPDGAGQRWAAPSSVHAAHFMRTLYEDRELAKSLGVRGKEFIEANYSLQVVAQNMYRRLAATGRLAARPVPAGAIQL